MEITGRPEQGQGAAVHSSNPPSKPGKIGEPMDALTAHAAAAELLAELPAQIHDMLEFVTCQVMELPPHCVPFGTKGLFQGLQQEGGPEDPAGLLPAHGVIQLYAFDLATAEEVQQTLLHEIGHALGLNEWEVAELGLAA